MPSKPGRKAAAIDNKPTDTSAERRGFPEIQANKTERPVPSAKPRGNPKAVTANGEDSRPKSRREKIKPGKQKKIKPASETAIPERQETLIIPVKKSPL
ncbi:MAG: hypothetical protein QGH40_13255, partial [bacterium]|nr:hypothetical protein [bacterium]